MFIEYIYSVNESLAKAPKDIDYYANLRSQPKKIIPKAARSERDIKNQSSTRSGIGINLDEELNEIGEHLLPEKKTFLDRNEALKLFQGVTPAESLSAIKQYYSNHNRALPTFNGQPLTSTLRMESLTSEKMPYQVDRKGAQFLEFLKKQLTSKESSISEQPESLEKFKKLEQQLEYLDKISSITQFRTGGVEKSTYSRDDVIDGCKQDKDFSGENLAGIDLSDLDLSGINLSGCNLSECNLTRTRLTHANLSTATLMHANLSEALLDNANLTHALIKSSLLDRANFVGCCLHNTLIEDSSGKECNFANAILNNASFKKCHFSEGRFIGLKANFLDVMDSQFQKSDFTEARMQFASIHKGSWSKINFMKADLSRALFEGTQLSCIVGDNLEAPHLSLNNCTLENLLLKNSHCERLSCKGATVLDSTFSNSALTGLNLMNANVTQSRFTNCQVMNLRGNENTRISMSHFEYCNLSNSALLGGHYEEVALNESTLDASQSVNSVWKKANFRKCSAKKFRFVNSKIDSCFYQDINFFQGIFHSSIFENTEFKHCNLYSIAFTDCQRKEVTIEDCLMKNVSLNEEEQSL